MSAERPSGSNWSPFGPAPEEDAPQSAPGPEFLFHLYRGSELLKDNQVDEAKSELERALAMQPKDVEGQSLLGIVYFRLGHYPRAIQIYEELVRARPTEVAPKINLALCYLKTGQIQAARAYLEEVVTIKPDHLRAWGYLGLAFQHLGDIDKAVVAFERSGRPELAARLKKDRSAEGASSARHSLVPRSGNDRVEEIEHGHANAALQADGGGLGRAEGPREPKRVPPAPVSRFCRDVLLDFPESPRVSVDASGSVVVRVEGWFALRPDVVRAIACDGAPFVQKTLQRRARGRDLAELLGGAAHPFVALEGVGRVVLVAPAPRRAQCLLGSEEPLYLREEHLLGFEATVEYENGRLTIGSEEQVPVVQLLGRGAIVLSAPERLAGIAVGTGRSIELRGDKVLGWTGRLIPSRLPERTGIGRDLGLVEFCGAGTVLVDTT